MLIKALYIDALYYDALVFASPRHSLLAHKHVLLPGWSQDLSLYSFLTFSEKNQLRPALVSPFDDEFCRFSVLKLCRLRLVLLQAQ